MQEELVVIYHAGWATPLVRSMAHSLSFFGGPLDREATGAHLAKPLHHIATIHLSHLQAFDNPHQARKLPLVYGLSYDSGLLRYSFEDHQRIAIAPGTLGEPTPDWPYRSYSELLPYVPLEVGKPAQETWEEFCKRAPNLPSTQPSELVVLVPPPATIGFSMWGPVGDAEGVTLVFECALERKTVTTYNVCG